MNRTGKTLIVIAVCICTAVVIGLTAAKIVTADEPTDTAKKEAMNTHAMRCTKLCQKNMEDISAAMTALDEAVKAIDAGNTAAAKAEIEKAKSMLAGMKMSIEQCMQKMPTVNDRCPITGKSIDMKNVPPDLTRMYKGMKVGFCCPACPPKWDSMSDEEKDAKLAEVMYKGHKEKMMRKGGEMMQQGSKQPGDEY